MNMVRLGSKFTRKASETSRAVSTSITAGNGGHVTLWSDDVTQFAGMIDELEEMMCGLQSDAAPSESPRPKPPPRSTPRNELCDPS